MEENIVKVPNLNIKPIEVKNCSHCKHCINLFYVERQDAYDVIQTELICNKNKKFEVELKDGDFYKGHTDFGNDFHLDSTLMNAEY